MSCRTVLPQKPPVAQLLIQFPVFYTTHQFITIFTTAPLTPSHPNPLAHPPSVLTYILHWTTQLLQSTCSVHFKHNADTPKWGSKNSDTEKSSNPLYNAPISNWYKQHLMKLQTQTSPTSSQAALLNSHDQNPNITTVHMLTVLLQWLCGEVWEREFSYLWQQRICYCVCSLVYRYIMATESRVDCSLWL